MERVFYPVIVPQPNGNVMMAYVQGGANRGSIIPGPQISPPPSGYFAGGGDPVMGEVEKLYRQYGPDSNPGLVQDVMRLVGDQPAASGWNNASYPQGVPSQYAAAQNNMMNQFGGFLQQLTGYLQRLDARLTRLEGGAPADPSQPVNNGPVDEEKVQEAKDNSGKETGAMVSFLKALKDNKLPFTLSSDEETRNSQIKFLNEQIRAYKEDQNNYEDNDQFTYKKGSIYNRKAMAEIALEMLGMDDQWRDDNRKYRVNGQFQLSREQIDKIDSVYEHNRVVRLGGKPKVADDTSQVTGP